MNLRSRHHARKNLRRRENQRDHHHTLLGVSKTRDSKSTAKDFTLRRLALNAHGRMPPESKKRNGLPKRKMRPAIPE